MFRRRLSSRARSTQIVILLPASILEAPPVCDESTMSARGYFDCELQSGNHKLLRRHIESLQELGVFIMILDPIQPHTPGRARGREHALNFGSVGRYRQHWKSWKQLISRICRDKQLSSNVRLDIRDMAYLLDKRGFPIMMGHRLMVHDPEEHQTFGDICYTLVNLAEELQALRSQRRLGVSQQHSSSEAQRPAVKKTLVCCGNNNKARLQSQQQYLPETPPDYRPVLRGCSGERQPKRPKCCLSVVTCSKPGVADRVAEERIQDHFGLLNEGSPRLSGG